MNMSHVTITEYQMVIIFSTKVHLITLNIFYGNLVSSYSTVKKVDKMSAFEA